MLYNKSVGFDSHLALSRLLFEIKVSEYIVLESGVRGNRLALLPNPFASGAIQALVCFVKHLNNISISYPERVLVF